MKILFKLFLIAISVQLIFVSPGLAYEIKDTNKYLIDVRGDDGSIYLNRLSLRKRLDCYKLEASAFSEAQWNFETSEWEKIMLGLQLKRSFWKYLYIGQSVQFISGQILDYMAFNADNSSIDTTTDISLRLPFFLKQLSLTISQQYTFNLEKGEGAYCETGAEVLYNPKGRYSLGLGWRHTDRIHNFDTDYVSLSLTLQF